MFIAPFLQNSNYHITIIFPSCVDQTRHLEKSKFFLLTKFLNTTQTTTVTWRSHIKYVHNSKEACVRMPKLIRTRKTSDTVCGNITNAAMRAICVDKLHPISISVRYA